MSTPYAGGENQGWTEQSSPDYSNVQPDYGTPIGASGEVVGLAGWGVRLGALLIDSVLLTVLQFAIGAVGGVIGAANDALGMTVVAIGYIGTMVWFMLLEAGPYGQTPGKAAVKIRVQRADGTMLSKWGSVGRYFGRILSSLPLGLGYFWPLWDAENRTFHDMVVNTRVVSVRESASFGNIVKAPFTRSTA